MINFLPGERYVEMTIKRCVLSNDGLTLIETLLSLFTIAFMLGFMPMIIKFFNVDDAFYNYDFDMFVFDIVETYNNSQSVYTSQSGTMLNFVMDSGNVSYRMNNSRIIKSVDGMGFITLLYEVERFEISNSEDITLRVKGDNGIIDETFTFRK